MQKARRITVQKAKQERAAEPLGIPTHLQILPVSAPVLCVQLASKGGGSARDRTRVLKSVARASRPAVSPPCAHGRDTLNVADHYLIEVSRVI
jgi:hypothetical protein